MIGRGYPQMPVRGKVGVAPLAALVFAVYVLGQHGTPTPHPAAPSRAATADIPPAYLALYVHAARACPRLRWGVLAGIGKVETNHGRGWPPDWTSRAGIAHGTENSAGAGGPMQFLAGTWAIYGRGGDRYDPHAAIPAAARLLCAGGLKANPPPPDPCPGTLGTPGEHAAVHAYNHACWYVARVLAVARAYQTGGGR